MLRLRGYADAELLLYGAPLLLRVARCLMLAEAIRVPFVCRLMLFIAP